MGVGAVIGALRINLGLDSAQLQRGVKESQAGIEKFAKAAAAGFATAAAAATGAFMAIQGAAQRADDAFKASQSFGIPIEQLGRLQYAAEMSGSSLEEIGKAAQRASRAVNDSMNGLSNAGTRAFEQLGVELTTTDGRARDVEAILGDVAEQFANMPDGAQKTALAIEMFGRTGANLIPTLNMGRDGLREMGDEAERLGLVFDERTGRASEVFNDNISRLSATMTGLWNQVLANVISGFADLTNKIIAATQSGGQLDMIVMGISAAMNVLVRAVGVVVDNFELLLGVVRTFIAIKIALFLGSTAVAMVAFARTVRLTGITIAAVTKLIGGKIQALVLLGAVIAEVTGTTQHLVGWLERTGQAIYAALPEGMQTGLDNFGETLRSLGGDIEGVSSLTADMFSTAHAGSELANGFERVGAAASNAATGVDTAKDAVDQLGVSGEQVTSTLANGLTDMFTSALDGSKSLMQSVGDLLKQLGTMFLNAGFQALLGMGGGGIFAGIGNFFSGLFGGGRAAGGPVSAGKTYLVGEKGPELFAPSTSGNIVPNHKLADQRPTQVQLIVQEGSLFEATVRRIAGEGDVQVAKTIERNFGNMQAEYQMRNT